MFESFGANFCRRAPERISTTEVLVVTEMGTFCPQLWDGCYIDRAGDVFACCHRSPLRFGNIHDSPLRDIVNSAVAIQARNASIGGRLDCHASCNLFEKDLGVPTGGEQGRIEYESLRRLHISFAEACNIRCIMCDHPLRHAKNPLILDPDTVIRNVDLTPFTTIMIQGGEPLYISECLEFMAHLEKLGKKYTLLTNGLLIDDAMALRLARHAKSVNFSLNGATKRGHESVNRGSRFERVVENVGRLLRAREALGTSLIVVGHMTITTSNAHEIPAFIELSRTIGFDRVNFGYVKETVPSFLSTRPDTLAYLRSETSSVLHGKNPVNADLLRLKMLGIVP